MMKTKQDIDRELAHLDWVEREQEKQRRLNQGIDSYKPEGRSISLMDVTGQEVLEAMLELGVEPTQNDMEKQNLQGEVTKCCAVGALVRAGKIENRTSPYIQGITEGFDGMALQSLGSSLREYKNEAREQFLAGHRVGLEALKLVMENYKDTRFSYDLEVAGEVLPAATYELMKVREQLVAKSRASYLEVMKDIKLFEGRSHEKHQAQLRAISAETERLQREKETAERLISAPLLDKVGSTSSGANLSVFRDVDLGLQPATLVDTVPQDGVPHVIDLSQEKAIPTIYSDIKDLFRGVGRLFGRLFKK